MLTSFVLTLREGVEMALIIGILLGALRKLDQPQLNRMVWYGVFCAGLVALLAAALLNLAGTELEGPGEAIFEGTTMLLAAVILTWMIFWMNRQAGEMKHALESKIRQAASSQNRTAIFLLAFLSVVREGIELALYLLAARFASNPMETLSGALIGLVTVIILGWFLIASSQRLSLRWLFQVTSVVLLFFAAGLVGLGIHALNEVGWIPAVIDHVWNLNNLLPESSFFGQVLKSLFGYEAMPSLTSVMFYLLYLGTLGFFLARPRPSVVRSSSQ
jgi:high-affinity iron transporter